jgi:MoaA/NifB/PqqE/SkfB family radical SAM enzyme
MPSYTPDTVPKLDFLWLELTNRCNLECVHCYTESHPNSGERDLLSARQYVDLMRQAYALGCRKMQFIGGEPQLFRDFHQLLIEAKDIGFQFIEVFTNLTRLDERTLAFAAENGIHFATSVYSDEPCEHDSITKRPASHTRTVRNIRRLVERGVNTRAGIIVMNQSRDTVSRTKRFLQDLGVKSINASALRQFGRGEEMMGRKAELSGLCGHCWAGKLCIAPDGMAYPCVMARQWPVGNVLEATLADIVADRPLRRMRQTIFDTVWQPRIGIRAGCIPEEIPIWDTSEHCDPETGCEPHGPGCSQSCGPDCNPSGGPCFPVKCAPDRCEPDGGCPQSHCDPTAGCEQTPCNPSIGDPCSPTEPTCPQSPNPG